MKTGFTRILGGMALAAVLAAPLVSTPALAEDKDVVDYRINLMKTLGEQAAAIGKIMQGKVAYTDNLAIHTDTIANTIDAALKAFEPKIVGGTAKGEIWDNWADFKDRFVKLQAAARDVSAAARSGGMAAAQPKLQGMFTCKACHDTYRTK
ncbi:MAG: cytochrome c [Rhodospirillaceae bacterium]|nr:cytochrome c [Rhodospirillaceae bacterium]